MYCIKHLFLLSTANKRVYPKYSRETSFYTNNIKPPSNNFELILVKKNNQNNNILDKNNRINMSNKIIRTNLSKLINRINLISKRIYTWGYLRSESQFKLISIITI